MKLTKTLLDGAEIDDSFGTLTALCESNDWRELVHKHSDQEDSYQFCLFDFVVMGSEVIAEHDLARINLSSLLMVAKLSACNCSG